jgi:pimeloyl-ACP methyl ester carboxylesterase
MTRTRRRSLLAVGALAAALTMTLSGCVTAFFPKDDGPGASTPAPVADDLDADLRPFYEQQLTWESCAGDGFDCATVTAPLDWENPAGGDIDLEIVRQRALGGDPIGSLLMNPGGPGASGYDLVADSVDFAAGDALQQNFDIVGFDPRGVERSAPVSCLDAEGMDSYLYDLAENEIGSDAWIAEVGESSKAFNDACAENTGESLEFVTTVSAARDLDLLRAVLGDATLNYLGYSYGTFLGATYAELYPENVGRLVLDGAIDPSASISDVNKAQSMGFESALAAYLEDCLDAQECPFSGSVDSAKQDIADLLASVQASPLPASDGRQLGSSTLLTAIIYPLYSADSWPYLSQMFDQVMSGDPTYAFFFADQYNGRGEDGEYINNQTEAFSAYNCRDYTFDADVDTMRQKAEELAQAAPVIGPYMGYGDIGCSTWPYPDQAERAEIHAAGADPIVVIGTTNDPATPYAWAESLADQLDSGVLVSYEGEGHTAYNKGSDCVNEAVEAYLVDGTVPEDGLDCS